MPIAILSVLAQSVDEGSWRTQTHTYRAEVHDAGEGDEPEVLGEDHPATIELGGDIRHLGE